MSALKEPTVRQWSATVADYLQSRYPAQFQGLRVEKHDIQDFVATVRKQAETFGITGRHDIEQLVVLAVSLGADFFHDPRFEAQIQSALSNENRASIDRVKALSDDALEWLHYVWGGKELGAFGRRLTQALRDAEGTYDDRAVVRRVLQSSLPGQWRMLSEDANRAFFAVCFTFAADNNLSSSLQRTAYTACAMAHGMRWWTDPLYRDLQNQFEGDVAHLVTRLDAFYARFG